MRIGLVAPPWVPVPPVGFIAHLDGAAPESLGGGVMGRPCDDGHADALARPSGGRA